MLKTPIVYITLFLISALISVGEARGMEENRLESPFNLPDFRGLFVSVESLLYRYSSATDTRDPAYPDEEYKRFSVINQRFYIKHQRAEKYPSFSHQPSPGELRHKLGSEVEEYCRQRKKDCQAYKNARVKLKKTAKHHKDRPNLDAQDALETAKSEFQVIQKKFIEKYRDFNKTDKKEVITDAEISEMEDRIYEPLKIITQWSTLRKRAEGTKFQTESYLTESNRIKGFRISFSANDMSLCEIMASCSTLEAIGERLMREVSILTEINRSHRDLVDETASWKAYLSYETIPNCQKGLQDKIKEEYPDHRNLKTQEKKISKILKITQYINSKVEKEQKTYINTLDTLNDSYHQLQKIKSYPINNTKIFPDFHRCYNGLGACRT